MATVRSGEPVTLDDESGHAILPSVVRYTTEQIIVGEAARQAAVSDPLNTISSAKRLIGRAISEVKALGDHLHEYSHGIGTRGGHGRTSSEDS